MDFYFGALLLVAISMQQARGNFDTSFVELDSSRMITTGENNYAIFSPNLPSNWHTISMNGDELTIATKDKQVLMKRLSQLSAQEKSSLDNIKMSLTAVIRLGPFNVKSETGLAKLTTFDRNGGTSSMSSGGAGGSSSSSSSSSGSSSGNSSSISKTGPNSYIVAKSDFPFNWQRVFLNDDLVTIVYKDGRVIMLSMEIMRPDERTSATELRKEVEASTLNSARMAGSFMNSLSHPIDFVNRAFNGLFG